ncbi:MAG TPA: tRNA pseudouridine(55) synthase TruB [Mariprofundaceae bacterium]|nr:tRNA pseudouridine(55) synthase TruB [Mariprofundaceae bacterium]
MVSGIVFLDKPRGWSSRRAVNEVARLFAGGRKPRLKAGHAGTLDPMATGMLPILLGEATRFAELGLNAEKTYAVTLDMSYQTDTLDAEGETTARFTDEPSLAQIEAVLQCFRGSYEQVPPQYSALRVDGRRAHALARRGETFTLAARPVEIGELRLVRYAWPELALEVHCSKGTYVRALARDIGDALGVGGCVVQLRRLSTGGWPPSMMVTPERLAERPEAALVPVSTWLERLPSIHLDQAQSRRFLLGQRLRMEDGLIASGLVAAYGDGILLGTAELRPGEGEHAVLHPGRILPSAQERYLR